MSGKLQEVEMAEMEGDKWCIPYNQKLIELSLINKYFKSILSNAGVQERNGRGGSHLLDLLRCFLQASHPPPLWPPLLRELPLRIGHADRSPQVSALQDGVLRAWGQILDWFLGFSSESISSKLKTETVSYYWKSHDEPLNRKYHKGNQHELRQQVWVVTVREISKRTGYLG